MAFLNHFRPSLNCSLQLASFDELELFEQGKIVSAFCHGPWVLISSGILKGKKATCYPGIIDDLKNAGAIYLDQAAVVDKNLITARHPRDVTDLMKAILAKFE